MKKERYIVEIEMPCGDAISALYIQDIIQSDCDIEEEGRCKVVVKEQQWYIDKAAEWFSYRFPNVSKEAFEKFKEDMKGEEL